MKTLSLIFSLRFILILLFPFFCKAQNYDWIKTLGSHFNDESTDVVKDQMGNIYVSGFFNETLNLLGSDPQFQISSKGEVDIFIVKMTPEGNIIWVKSFGGPRLDVSYGMVYDNKGNLYLTGEFLGTADFDPGVSEFLISSSGNNDAFIVKLDTAGNFQWAKSIGSIDFDFGSALVCHEDGSITMGGSFGAEVDFDPGPGVHKIWSNSYANIFLVKFDERGEFKWVKTFKATGNDFLAAITFEDNNYLITGSFDGKTDFSSPSQNRVLQTIDGIDAFIAKLDATGEPIWVQQLGGSGIQSGSCIYASDNSDYYFGGVFAHSVDFQPGTNVHELTATGIRDAYLLKVNSDGDLIWVKQFGGLDITSPVNIFRDSNGSLLLTGNFVFDLDVDPGPERIMYNSKGFTDIFLIALSPEGQFLNADTEGGSGRDQIAGGAFDDKYGFCFAGYYSGTVVWDDKNHLQSNSGSKDIIIFKTNRNFTVHELNTTNETLNVYPNPFMNKVIIDTGLDPSNIEISLFSTSGELIDKQYINGKRLLELEIKHTGCIFILHMKDLRHHKVIKLVKLP